MITVVIVGAGGFARHIGELLSKEQHDVIFIDTDSEKLEKASQELEVGVRHGSGTDWQLLDELLDHSPKVLLALTENDERNLVTCSIAKHLGYPRTIARMQDGRYLNCSRLDFAHIFDADSLFCPEIFVAAAIYKSTLAPHSQVIEQFAHGAVQLRTFSIPDKWNSSEVPLESLDLPKNVIITLIHRHLEGKGKKLIFPHGENCLLPGDEITVICETRTMEKVYRFFHIEEEKVDSVFVVGGSKTGVNLCKFLEKREIGARIVEKSFTKCSFLANELQDTAILHHDGTDWDFLQAEKLDRVSVFVACTGQDEINLLLGQLAKEANCSKIIILLSDPDYIPLAKKAGIDCVISPYVSAANHALSQIFSGTVSSLISLYENRAEVMEINVSTDSKIAGIPLKEVSKILPKDLLIALIENRGRVMVANGDRILSPGDTVIVVSNPKHAQEMETIF